MKKIKILHLVPGLDAGGISVLLLNYYKNMDRGKIQFDFAIFYETVGMTGKEFEKLGSKIYHLPPKSKNFKEYKKELAKIIKENNYDIVHAHQNYMSFIPLEIAKKCGVKVRISHSHTTAVEGFKQKIYLIIGRIFTSIYATHKFACGKKAGEFIYGEKSIDKGEVYFLNNAIDVNSYAYDSKLRKSIRKDLKLEDNFIIGTVGRLSREKNQRFAIDILSDILKTESKARLLLIGNGSLEDELKKYTKDKNLDNEVIFLGKRDDVNKLLQAMDIFILPSFHEGFPVTGVEAVSSSIPCVFSCGVTEELKMRDEISFIPINQKEEWIKTILKYKDYDRKEISKKVMIENGYDIKTNAKVLEEKYISMAKEK